MRCPRCNDIIDAQTNFCRTCGRKTGRINTRLVINCGVTLEIVLWCMIPLAFGGWMALVISLACDSHVGVAGSFATWVIAFLSIVLALVLSLRKKEDPRQRDRDSDAVFSLYILAILHAIILVITFIVWFASELSLAWFGEALVAINLAPVIAGQLLAIGATGFLALLVKKRFY
jgi:hypothetical protein